MYPIYPPYDHFLLNVDHIGKVPIDIYVELCGNPKGIPVIYLHGGPGDKDSAHVRTLFNPKVYNLILYDQRGCGRSTPRNHLEKNTTPLLLKDLEQIRNYLDIPKMVVTGGSWGTSLAVLYAEMHPSRVIALVLRGFFDLIGEDDVLASMDPIANHDMLTLLHLPETASSRQIFEKQHKILHSKHKDRRKLIYLLSDNETMYAMDKVEDTDSFRDKETLAIIGNHYEMHHYFVKKYKIIDDLYKIKHLPIIVITGKSDIITPPYMSYDLCQHVKCKWRIVRGGHTYLEKTIGKAFKEEMDELGKKLSR